MAEKNPRPDSSDDESSDDDFGPMPASAVETAAAALAASASGEKDREADAALQKPAKKKARSLKFENVYVDSLPSSEFYEHSFMHRDIVSNIAVSKTHEFVITGSVDGHVKFWKKMCNNIEFVKHYQAHLGPISALVVSHDGNNLVTTSSDKMIKIFEIAGFDMANMVEVAYVPTCAAWLVGARGLCDRVAVADRDSGKIRIYKSADGQEAIHEVDLHSHPVKCICLNSSSTGTATPVNVVVSVDVKGIIEYWNVDDFQMPGADKISFKLKSETDLYDLAKSKAVPYSLAVSPTGTQFAMYASDKHIRLFDFRTGKLTRKYDESAKQYAANSATAVDSLDYGRRLAVERELEACSSGSASGVAMSMSNVIFDESGHFLLFSSLKGIKIVNTYTNKVVRIVGSAESAERFLHIALYQGIPKVDAQLMLSRAGADAGAKTAEDLHAVPVPDPTIFATSFKKRRFFCLSNREPDESKEARDKLNEMPTEEETRNATVTELAPKMLNSEAVLRTTLGDIHIKLFAQECPKTVENFVTHIKNKYYDGVIFHRVIKGFMIQTGDPLGDGTGGESIWGREFEDEFSRNLRHDRPFTVSMANAGPNTNGSQFFITTVATSWLDNKHTIFGRVSKGFDIVSKIEGLKVNKADKPYDTVKILSMAVF